MDRAPATPRGLFDRSTAGLRIKAPSYPVERGRIAFLCSVIGETNAIHFDASAARARGYPGIVAPPTFAQVIEQESTRIAEFNGERTVFNAIRADYRYLLHGAERYDFAGYMLAGDELTVCHEVVGFEFKKGGVLEMAYLHTVIESPERGPVVEIARTVIHRLPERAE
ncbi:MaoC family dehydratase N-terminal domain-containing protein [Pseudoruegeria sp. HB172150]|uniref:FAS1-like dehydratase domain-containing protein n=1 Tax=Pseudoruegeria sp. HB172150 TaxID=2721164 RepID=UPI0015535EF0|nr:MaoC family dehydratase N-terminal domain-containing protein [Pseudoruegeria sp. HB172150]